MAMALANSPLLWRSGVEEQPPQQQQQQQQQQEEVAPNRLRRTRAILGRSRRAGKPRQRKASVKSPAAAATAAGVKPRGLHRCHWIERQVDEEFDMVLVPADGCCMSGTESEDSDWSVGWMEPHSSDFASDSEESFAVIVPCYGSSSPRLVSATNPPAVWAAALLFSSTSSATTNNAAEQRKHVEEWLSSLQQQQMK